MPKNIVATSQNCLDEMMAMVLRARPGVGPGGASLSAISGVFGCGGSWVTVSIRTAIARVMPPMIKNVGRHPQVAAAQANGVVATTAPKLPTDMSRPTMVANSLFLNHWEKALTVGT